MLKKFIRIKSKPVIISIITAVLLISFFGAFGFSTKADEDLDKPEAPINLQNKLLITSPDEVLVQLSWDAVDQYPPSENYERPGDYAGPISQVGYEIQCQFEDDTEPTKAIINLPDNQEGLFHAGGFFEFPAPSDKTGWCEITAFNSSGSVSDPTRTNIDTSIIKITEFIADQSGVNLNTSVISTAIIYYYSSQTLVETEKTNLNSADYEPNPDIWQSHDDNLTNSHQLNLSQAPAGSRVYVFATANDQYGNPVQSEIISVTVDSSNLTPINALIYEQNKHDGPGYPAVDVKVMNEKGQSVVKTSLATAQVIGAHLVNWQDPVGLEVTDENSDGQKTLTASLIDNAWQIVSPSNGLWQVDYVDRPTFQELEIKPATPQYTGSLQGTVKYQNNQTAIGAKVEIVAKSKLDTTDTNGWYDLLGIPLAGNAPETVDVQVTNLNGCPAETFPAIVNPGQITRKDITLSCQLVISGTVIDANSGQAISGVNLSGTALVNGAAQPLGCQYLVNGSYNCDMGANPTSITLDASASGYRSATVSSSYTGQTIHAPIKLLTISRSADTTAPVINHAPPPANQDPNQNYLVSAAITDNLNVQQAKLYFKAEGAANWSNSLMVKDNDRYTYVINKANFVSNKKLYYYLEAIDDANNQTRQPAAAPTSYHQVSFNWPPPSDSTAPTISYNPPTSTLPSTQDLTVSAIITDNIAVQNATVFYQAEGAGSWQILPMTNNGSTYTANISRNSFVRDKKLFYYIEAFDSANNRATSPTNAPPSYHQVDFNWSPAAPVTIQAINYLAKGSYFNPVNHFLDNSPVMRAFTNDPQSYLTYKVDFGSVPKQWLLKVTGANGTNSLPANWRVPLIFDVAIDADGSGTNFSNLDQLWLKATNYNWVNGYLNLGSNLTGVRQIKLTVQNDSYQPGVYDNNPAVKSLEFLERNLPAYAVPTNGWINSINYQAKGSHFHHRLAPLESYNAPAMIAYTSDATSFIDYKFDFGANKSLNWKLTAQAAQYGANPKPSSTIKLDVYLGSSSRTNFSYWQSLTYSANTASYLYPAINLQTELTGVRTIRLMFANDEYLPNTYDNNALLRNIKIEAR